MWTLLIGYLSLPRLVAGPSCPIPCLTASGYDLSPLLLASGIVLLVDSAICFAGLRPAFALAAGLSGFSAILVVIQSGTLLALYPLASVLLAAAAVVLDILAARFRPRVSEQAHPMNLPVFG